MPSEPRYTKRPWRPAEDETLVDAVERIGVPIISSGTQGGEHKYPQWTDIANLVPDRVAKQCRERWRNHLDPAVNRDSWAPEENDLLLSRYDEFGSSWAEISQGFVGRPDNACKNQWNKLTGRGKLRRLVDGQWVLSENPPKTKKQKLSGTPSTWSSTPRTGSKSSSPSYTTPRDQGQGSIYPPPTPDEASKFGRRHGVEDGSSSDDDEEWSGHDGHSGYEYGVESSYAPPALSRLELRIETNSEDEHEYDEDEMRTYRQSAEDYEEQDGGQEHEDEHCYSKAYTASEQDIEPELALNLATHYHTRSAESIWRDVGEDIRQTLSPVGQMEVEAMSEETREVWLRGQQSEMRCTQPDTQAGYSYAQPSALQNTPPGWRDTVHESRLDHDVLVM